MQKLNSNFSKNEIILETWETRDINSNYLSLHEPRGSMKYSSFGYQLLFPSRAYSQNDISRNSAAKEDRRRPESARSCNAGSPAPKRECINAQLAEG